MFSKRIQKILNYFVFFLSFPFLNLLGSSVTFYIFIYLIFIVGFKFYRYYTFVILFYLLFCSLILSSIFSPQMLRNPSFEVTLKYIFQFTYWISVSLFFIFYFRRINILELSKWIFYGCLFSISGYYLLPFNFNFGFISITFQETRNSFVFDLLCTIPISFIYIYNTYSRKTNLIFLFGFIFALLFTNGRSGSIIIFIEAILILNLLFPKFVKNFKFFLIPLLILGFAFSFTPENIKVEIAESFNKINPRLSKLILAEEGDDEGDLSMDKSWLHRRLMIDKSFEIFKKYPLLGIGPNKFRYYDSPLNTYNNYERLGNESIEWFNNRSAHNSYIQILSEFGLLGLITLLLIIIMPIIFLLRELFNNNKSLFLLPFFSLIGIAIHFYAISALTGAIPFFIFGYCWGYLKLNSN